MLLWGSDQWPPEVSSLHKKSELKFEFLVKITFLKWDEIELYSWLIYGKFTIALPNVIQFSMLTPNLTLPVMLYTADTLVFETFWKTNENNAFFLVIVCSTFAHIKCWNILKNGHFTYKPNQYYQSFFCFGLKNVAKRWTNNTLKV